MPVPSPVFGWAKTPSGAFQIISNGNLIESDTFNDLASAQAFFSNNLLAIGLVAGTEMISSCCFLRRWVAGPGSVSTTLSPRARSLKVHCRRVGS